MKQAIDMYDHEWNKYGPIDYKLLYNKGYMSPKRYKNGKIIEFSLKAH